VPAEVAVVHDSVPDAGPLAGIVAALAKCRGAHLLVLAVDLPRMEPVWFAQLAAACTPGRGAVGRRGGFYEPLAAIYPRGLLPAAEQALARGDFSLQHLITAAGDLMAAREITDAEASWFENWNEPAEPR
jgi:molybdopterin-guanine dinucleotide biosynthesis protein A